MTYARLCLLALVLLSAACDSSFSPTAAHDLQFSIFGYLDVSADTQWIRVMPIRSTTGTAPTSPDALVTLEHLGSGRVITLRDSLFSFSVPNPEVGTDAQYLHNYWTDEAIEPGAEYRFTAQRLGGPPSEALITMPEEYDIEVWLGRSEIGEGDFVHLEGLRHVAFVAGLTSFYDACGEAVQSVSFGKGSPDSEVQTIRVRDELRFRQGCGSPKPQKRELLVIGSGAPWPEGGDYSASGLGIPAGASNVSNSVGFVGGVLTMVVPYEECRLLNPTTPTDPCKLRYDESSATLRGVVRDANCEREPIENAGVELRELSSDPQQPLKSRSASTGRFGDFEIGALEEGRSYALTVRRFVLLDRYDQYWDHVDTLQFAAGQEKSYDIDLRAFACAP